MGAYELVEVGASQFDEALGLAQEMHAASRYKGVAFDDDSMRQTLHSLIEQGAHVVGAYVGGMMVGLHVGVVGPYFFNAGVLYAADLGVFVSPAVRGLGIGEALIRHFANWATMQGAVAVCHGVSAGIGDVKAGQLLGQLGFVQVGQLFELGVGRDV